MTMHFVLYASSAVRPLDDDQIQGLLEVSRRNNATVNVSGMLLYYEGSFLQYIEGEKEDVMSLYARIADDRRHHGLFVLDSDTIDDRAVSAWTMGYNRLDAAQQKLLGSFDLSAQALEQALDVELPRTVHSMMRTFYRTAHRYA